MIYFGLGASIFIFSTLVLLLILYYVSASLKKYDFANAIFPYILLHSIFTALILAWALVIMNKNFNINYSLDIEYSMILFFIVPIVIITGIIDSIVRKNCKDMNSKIKKIYRYLLPVFIFIMISVCVVILYFNVQYFWYLTRW